MVAAVRARGRLVTRHGLGMGMLTANGVVIVVLVRRWPSGMHRRSIPVMTISAISAERNPMACDGRRVRVLARAAVRAVNGPMIVVCVVVFVIVVAVVVVVMR